MRICPNTKKCKDQKCDHNKIHTAKGCTYICSVYSDVGSCYSSDLITEHMTYKEAFAIIVKQRLLK